MNPSIIQKALLKFSLFLLLVLGISGCSIIGGIFKTGVQVGIFITIVVIIIILVLINRFKKR
jgi:hypothetical protein